MPPTPLQIPVEQQITDDGSKQAKVRLASLCRNLRNSAKSSREKDYILDLRDSCDSLELQEAKFQVHGDISNSKLVILMEKYLNDCRSYFEDINFHLQKLVQSGDKIAAQSGQLPRLSTTFWLRQLNRDPLRLPDPGLERGSH